MEALRQSARSMYAYACFDLECLYRELAATEQPRRDVRQALSARADELVGKISRNLLGEVLATEYPNDPEVVAVADGFAESMGTLCRGLLESVLSGWVRQLPL